MKIGWELTEKSAKNMRYDLRLGVNLTAGIVAFTPIIAPRYSLHTVNCCQFTLDSSARKGRLFMWHVTYTYNSTSQHERNYQNNQQNNWKIKDKLQVFY